MITFTFDQFDYIDPDITFPKNVIFFSTCSTILDTPIYLTSKDTTKLITTKLIKIIDICKLKNIIKLIINSRKSNDEIMIECIKSLTFTFGDSKSIMILRELFEGIYDGFITFGQIIIFNPKLSGLKIFTNDSRIIHIRNLNDALCNSSYKSYILTISEKQIIPINKYDDEFKKEVEHFRNNVRLYKPKFSYPINLGEMLSLPPSKLYNNIGAC